LFDGRAVGSIPRQSVAVWSDVQLDDRTRADAVVARGTTVLVAAGAGEIRGDCDASNIGMFKAFQRGPPQLRHPQDVQPSAVDRRSIRDNSPMFLNVRAMIPENSA